MNYRRREAAERRFQGSSRFPSTYRTATKKLRIGSMEHRNCVAVLVVLSENSRCFQKYTRDGHNGMGE